ncbi:MAG: D-alanine--D-alanine ligase [Bacillaceae bacterium]|nr:D-alanine--D-alanine ligase [Bacillaceae bacterium]
MRKKINLGIIYGGKSSEHEVSLKTAFSIIQAVDQSKYHIIPIYINLNGEWHQGDAIDGLPASVDELRLRNGESDMPPILLQLKDHVDIVFPVIHGPNGEDGTLQGLLEMLNIPYVGSGVLGSAAGMDKVAMKALFGYHGLPQGDFLAIKRFEVEEAMDDILSRIESRLAYPCFVKPANMGSSVGISKAGDRDSLRAALIEAARYDRKIVVEQFIDGRELEVSVLGNEQPRTSVVGEILPAHDFYDYAAKYKDTGTELQIPARIPAHVEEQIKQLAVRAYQAVDAAGLSRVDFFWDEKEDRVYINEINTLPGFTPFSMYPMLWKEAGLSYTALIDELIRLGFERYEEKNKNAVEAEKLD